MFTKEQTDALSEYLSEEDIAFAQATFEQEQDLNPEEASWEGVF